MGYLHNARLQKTNDTTCSDFITTVKENGNLPATGLHSYSCLKVKLYILPPSSEADFWSLAKLHFALSIYKKKYKTGFTGKHRLWAPFKTCYEHVTVTESHALCFMPLS